MNTQTYQILVTKLGIMSLVAMFFVSWAILFYSDYNDEYDLLSEIKKVKIKNNNKVTMHIENIKKNSKYLNISGWAFLDKYSTHQNTIYVAVTTRSDTLFFSTTSVTRPDVTSAHNQHNRDQSGFTAWINRELLPHKDYQIGIYIDRGDVDGIGYWNSSPPVGSKQGEFVSNLKSVTVPQFQTNELKVHIEHIDKLKEYILISGWAFQEKNDTKNSEHYVVLNGSNAQYVYNSQIVFRPDITKAFPEYNRDRSGFVARIKAKSVKPGIYKIGIIVDQKKTQVIKYWHQNLSIDNGSSNPLSDITPSHNPAK